MLTRARRPARLLTTALLLTPALALAPALAATAQPASPDPGGDPAPTSPASGGWTITTIAPGRHVVSWTASSDLPVTDARPEITVGDQPAAATTLDADGRTVTATVRGPAPSVADLDVMLSGQVLDGGAAAPAAPAVPYAPPAGAKRLDDDPGVPGTHAIVTDDYQLDPVKLPDIRQLSEMVGHVVAPADADASSPLVLFLHGRHSACYKPRAQKLPGISGAARSKAPTPWQCPGRLEPIPSYLGYDYAQRLLASQGYVTVSISANAINDLDWRAADGGAEARAALIEHHLEAWVDFVADDTYHADLDNVVLVGHSRGGEGADRAAINLPVGAPFTVTGQVLIGPTDFAFQASPYVPTVTLLPYCDGDVSDLQGQNFTDAARDLVSHPIAFHSSVLVMGANHNFFNTEWTPGISAAPSFDDWGGRATKTCGVDTDMRLSAAQQRKVGKSYIAGAVHLFADGDQRVLPMFDGSNVTVPSAGNADARSHAIGGGLDIRRPKLDAGLTTDATAQTRFCQGKESRRAIVCDPRVESTRTPHWPGAYQRGVAIRQAFEMSWDATGQHGGLALDNPWDLSTSDWLDLRTIVDPEHGPVRLRVQLEDGTGDVAVITPDGDGRLRPLPAGGYSLSKRWAQTLRAPLGGAGADVDLSDITSVELVAANASGRVWVLDMSAHPAAGLPAPPNRDTPWLSIGTVEQPEGDAGGTQTVPVPYTIGGGPLDEDAIVNVVTVDEWGGTSGRPSPMLIPAGTTSGTIDIEYESDVIDGPNRRNYFVAVYPVTGVATNRYIGGATIIDDDPAPTLTVKPIARSVAEGSRLRYAVRLSAPTMKFVSVFGVPVRNPGSAAPVTAGDVTRLFLRRHLSEIPDRSTPLWKTDLRVYGYVEPGKLGTVLSVPTATDDRREGRRALTLRFRAGKLVFDRDTATVGLTDG